MGALVLFGFELFIGLVLGGIVTILGLFFGHIILFDSIALAILSGVLSHALLQIHPAIAIVIGIAVFILLFFLQNTKVGFWIIGGILSLFRALCFLYLPMIYRGKIWYGHMLF